ncbi:helix-turn-helix transcriptional regulator [bacterium]|nr:helix-turn-helix transcriptional regulator [bacterium]
MTDIKESLGKKIKNLRKSKGFSQIEFAEKIGLSTNGLSVIETGNGFLTADTLEKILTVLNIEPDELFSFGGTKNEQQLYKDVIRLLENIKYDREKLAKVYNIIKYVV